MDQSELVQRLLATFVVELDEHVRTLEFEAIAAERGATPAHVDALFRAAHSIKGAARSVGIEPIEAAAHEAEDRLGAIRDGSRAFDAETGTLLLGLVDRLRAAGAALAEGRPLAGIFGPVTGEPDLRAPVVADVDADARAFDAITVLARGLVDRAAEDDQGALEELAEAWRRGRGDPDVTIRVIEGMLRRQRGARASILRTAVQLEDALDDLRMIGVVEVLSGLPRGVRDLAKSLGKEIELVVDDGGATIERAVARGLGDALLHVVRNAADHGVETPDVRVARGKPPAGRITVSARLTGDFVEVVVRDDGQGLDRPALVRALASRGGSADSLDDEQLAEAAFLPGLSSASAVTDVSGRGVGLDAVRAGIQALNGTVRLAFESGRGTSVTIKVPRSIARLRVLVVVSGGATLALPVHTVVRIVRAQRAALVHHAGREALLFEGVPIRLATIDAVLGGSSEIAGDNLTIVVLAVGHRRVGVVVDRVVVEREIVVHSLGPRVRGLRHVLGAAAIQGQPVIIIEAAELHRRLLASDTAAWAAVAAPTTTRRSILLADDSLTTRTLERIILEGAGYDVVAAGDGIEAWQLLQDHPVDLVVSDVEMPRLDGVGLCERIRASQRFAELPLVLVTALDTERDRARGLAAGADAYVVKSSFDQKGLLDVIAQLLP